MQHIKHIKYAAKADRQRKKEVMTMIKSMTGFGRAEYQDATRKITVEIKSVNHRYLDFNIKTPKKFSFYEAQIRTLLKEYMSRGKVDVFITNEELTEDCSILQFNGKAADAYMGYFAQMAERYSIPNDVTVSVLGRMPDVLTMEDPELDEEEIWKGMETALRKAGEAFRASREREGANLAADLEQKLDGMLALVTQVEERGPELLKAYRERIETKVREVLQDTQLDEGRIAAEVVLYADKICTDEETVRLKSHVSHMKQVLAEGNGIGRKLDFMAQEMNREANTILSKANDLTTTDLGIDLKTEIEKIREQIQNIE